MCSDTLSPQRRANRMMLTYAKHSIGVLLALIVYVVTGLTIFGSDMNDVDSDPGVLPEPFNLFVIVLIQYLSIVVIFNSVSGGKARKIVLTAMLYYFLVVFVMQLETLFFREQLQVSAGLAVKLFIFGLPMAIFIPLYLGLSRAEVALRISSRAVLNRLKFISAGALLYVLVYLCAGYYLAWVHLEIRQFYGYDAPLLSFSGHMFQLLTENKALLAFQLLRGIIWSFLVLVILVEVRDMQPVMKLAIVNFLVAAPQNIAHIGRNSIITESEVRMIHLFETGISMIAFGTILCFLYIWIFPNVRRGHET